MCADSPRLLALGPKDAVAGLAALIGPIASGDLTSFLVNWLQNAG
jgi:hypothetical protein